MAVTIAAGGTGAATVTPSAALEPLCPATVDAGMVLLAHVAWNDQTSTPATPSGWTLLTGPHDIGTPQGRHWIFGKIADGTEDNAAVSFGTEGGAVKRWGRIYTFTGRVSGNIEDLAGGFTSTTNALDPMAPTVTTTSIGAVALAFTAQTDDNAIGSFTGESGGNWLESTVAEYTSTVGNGVMMQVQFCIPTANPGTVTGGTFNTANDPVGVIGMEVRPDARVGPGGAAAAGTSPLPKTATAAGGAQAGGVGPKAYVQPGVGAATAGGVSPIPSVTPSPGGGVGGGVSPDTGPTQVSTGGATAGGIFGTARVPVPLGGAAAAGIAPSEASEDVVPQGGATAGGNPPSASVPTVIGGATGAGTAATASVPVAPGGALAGGTTPTEVETPIPGGATAGGFSPSARTVAGTGGAAGAGVPATAATSVSVGGATAQGIPSGSSVRATPLPGGATAQGVSPLVAVPIPRGLATALGVSQDAVLVLVPPGGAEASGVSPIVPWQGTAEAGGGVRASEGGAAVHTAESGGGVLVDF